MIMTKREIVLDSFGEFKKYVERYVDENGWLNIKDHSSFIRNHFYLTDNLETKFVNKFGYWRPKSLNGIEENNGWIKIESESDLPKELEKIYFIIKGYEERICIGYYCHDLFWDLNEDYSKQIVTHYQPIQKPLLPIY